VKALQSKHIFRISGFFCLIPVIIYLLIALHVASYTSISSDSKADAAIVLGAKSYKGDSYNPCLVSRVNQATDLIKNQQVNYLVLSGGNDLEDNSNEAETMKMITLEQGVLADKIILEKQATSTYENLILSKQLMDQNGLTTAIIVSEPFHMARSRLIARSLGISAQYQASQESPCWNKWKYASRYFLKEPIAIAYYLLTGKIKLSSF